MASHCTVLRSDAERWVRLPPLDLPDESRGPISEAKEMTPDHINPLQWHQAMGLARQSCARIFRDGGAPSDALAAFGVSAASSQSDDWSKVVTAIALELCRQPLRKAA
jgi:hypothetical protein